MLVVLAKLASAHNSAVQAFCQTLAVQLEAASLLTGAAVGYPHRQARLQSDAVRAALGRARQRRQETIAVVHQALLSHKTHAVVDLGRWRGRRRHFLH